MLHLPDNKGRFQFLDTSKTTAGSALHQIQDSIPKLIGCASVLPHAAVKYSITELELLSLCVNMSHFKHLLAKVDFECTVDHLALIYIMESKTQQASTRAKRLLEVLSAYSSNSF